MSCTDCSIHKLCRNPYLDGRGGKVENVEYMIIQDAPTFFDDRCDKVLQGDTRLKLNYLLEKADISYGKVYFTSAIKCAPKKLSDIKNKHIEACRKYLLAEIIKYKPKVIITMGKIAHQALTEKTSVFEFRGHFTDFKMDYEVDYKGSISVKTFECKLIPTYGLVGSLKKWEWNPTMESDLRKAKKYVEENTIDRTPDTTYKTVLSLKELKDFFNLAMSEKYCATDFETTGFHFWKNKIINAGYAFNTSEAHIVYLEPYKRGHIRKWDKENIDRAKQINYFLSQHRDRCLNTLKKVHDSHLKFILHNGKFDQKFAIKYGIRYRNYYYDTLSGDALIDENMPHSLNIALERRGINYGPYDTGLWKYTNKDEKKKKSYQFVPPLILDDYLAKDVCGTKHLFKIQKKELKEEGMVEHMLSRKMPMMRDLTTIEYAGFKADRSLIEKTSLIIQEKEKTILAELKEITNNEEFNPNSGVQISNYMVEAGYPLKKLNIRQTSQGYSADKENLSKFLKYPKYADFPKLVLNYKKLGKIKGTYVDGMKGDGGMIQYLDQTNRIHTNYNSWTPRTSRLSAKGPSVQVWPRPIKLLPNARNFVIPTSNDWLLWEYDFISLEIIVVAALSGDKLLTRLLKEGEDMHCYNGTELGHILKVVPDWVTYEHMLLACDKKEIIKDISIIPELQKDIEKHGSGINFVDIRTMAKGVQFGLNYGKEASTFAEEYKLTEYQAEDMVEGYFDKYYGMRDWRTDIVAEVMNKGFITLMSGRKRRFHAAVDFLTSDHGKECFGSKNLEKEIARQAMNFPVQGNAHEIFETTLLKVNKAFRDEKIKARSMLLIHDGNVGECRKEHAKKVVEIIQKHTPYVMNKGTPNELTLNTDIHFFKDCWYGQKIKLDQLDTVM